MRMIMLAVPAAATLVAAGTVSLGAPPQKPGEITPARVWVQNKGRSEAVSVDLREVNLDAPLRVQVVNAQTPRAEDAVQVRLVRQTWEYETIRIASGQGGALALSQRGAAGWETTGVAWTDADGTTIVLKRPR